MSVKPLSVPKKFLTKAISSAATSFKVNNIKSWALNALGQNINLTASDFGTQAFCVFRNDTGSKIEIMEFDPATIASASISILNRGLPFDGTTTPVATYKLDWPAGTIIEFGTDVPQLLQILANDAGLVDSVNGQTGTVVLTKTDISLGNVDNTSDVNKPVSTAQQTALDLKANLISPSFTTPALGTPSSGNASNLTNTTGINYVAVGAVSSPVDTAWYYIGTYSGVSSQDALDDPSCLFRMFIQKTGTIKSFYLTISNFGTLGSNETAVIKYYKNGSEIASIFTGLSTNVAGQSFNSTGLNYAVTAGDYVYFKFISPTWATNPTNLRFSVQFYVE